MRGQTSKLELNKNIDYMHKRSIRYLLTASLALSSSLVLVASPKVDSLAAKAAKPAASKQDTKPAPKKEEKKKEDKKNDPYTRFFKDKKVETVSGKFVTLHKMDGEVYLELPTKYLGKELIMGATITSTTDPDYLPVGSRSSAPFVFRFERQDSVLVMKTPNTIVYRRDASRQLQEALELNYRDQTVESFRPEVYKSDSSAVVLRISSLVGGGSPFFKVIPEQQGAFRISSSQNSSLTFVRGIKAFDTNASIKVEQAHSLTISLMGLMTVARDMPVTTEVTYTIMPATASTAIPRLADARVGYETSRQVSFPDHLDQSEPVYLAHRWQLVPRDKKAYAKGILTEPERKITFYIDPNMPAGWSAPIRQGVLRWNKAFEAAGFKNVLEVLDYPKDKNFDPDNIEYNCIRYVPNTQADVTTSTWVDPRTGEITGATIAVFNNVETTLHKQRFVATAAADPAVRSARLSDELFFESLSALVTQRLGKVLGLLPNYAASAAYTVDQLRSASFTQANGLSASVLDGAPYNFLAQAGDKGLRLVNSEVGPYDLYAVNWGYRYYDQLGGDPAREAKELLAMVDKKAGDARFRYAPEQRYSVDPTVRVEDLGNDPLRAASLELKNLAYIKAHLSDWIKNDPDSRKKTALYLALAQRHYLVFKNVMALVGGVVCREERVAPGTPRYQVVPKAKQREAFLWVLNEAKNFQRYADRQLERRLFINVSYYDQLLEFLNNDLLNLRSRVIIAAQVDPKSYSLGEYFADFYQAVWGSTLAGRPLNHMERLMQASYIDKSIATVNNPRAAAPAMTTGFASPRAELKALQLVGGLPSELDYTAARSSQSSYGGSNPSASIYPMANVPTLDKSELYYYDQLRRLRPVLEQRAASTTDQVLKAHYQTLAFKVARFLDAKK